MADLNLSDVAYGKMPAYSGKLWNSRKIALIVRSNFRGLNIVA